MNEKLDTKQIIYEEMHAMPLAKKTDYTIDYIYSLQKDSVRS